MPNTYTKNIEFASMPDKNLLCFSYRILFLLFNFLSFIFLCFAFKIL